MANNPKPLLDAQTGSRQEGLPGLMAAALSRFAIDDDNLIPARVVAFDRVKNLVTVQPQIMWIGMDDSAQSRHRIANIPCLSIGGGGFHISFPLKQGDLGWIFAGDRDISLFKQTLNESKPNTHRIHKFQDGLFIPDVWRQYALAADADGAMVIQSTDAVTRITIAADHINIDSPVSVNITTPVTNINGNMHVTGDVQLDSKLNVDAMTTLNGGFSASAGAALPCELPPTTTVAGKQVDGHDHGGVFRGGDNTDPF